MGIFNLFRKKSSNTTVSSEPSVSVQRSTTIQPSYNLSLLDLKREYHRKFVHITGDLCVSDYDGKENSIWLSQYTPRDNINVSIRFQNGALDDTYAPLPVRLRQTCIGEKTSIYGILEYRGQERFILDKAFFTYSEKYLTNIERYLTSIRDVPQQDFIIKEGRNNRYELTEYVGKGSDIIVPSVINGKEISVIQENAFFDSKAKSISLPNTIIRIAEYAFPNCPNLKYIQMGESVENISRTAFYEMGGKIQCNGMIVIAPQSSRAEKFVRKMGIPCYQSVPSSLVYSLQKYKQAVCRSCIGVIKESLALHFEAIILLTVIIDFVYACQEKDRYALNDCTLDWAQRICLSDNNRKEYHQRIELYGSIIRGRPLRGEWLFGKTQPFEDDPIWRCVVAFGDILINPNCANNYDSAPIELHDIEHVLNFSNVAMKGVMEAITNFVKAIAN